MRTTDALRIGMELGRIRGALDAWEENKHPRADNGQFTSGSGGGGKSATFKEATKRRSQTKAKENEAAVSKAKKTLSDIDKKIAQAKKDGDQKRASFLGATKKRAEKTSGKPTKEAKSSNNNKAQEFLDGINGTKIKNPSQFLKSKAKEGVDDIVVRTTYMDGGWYDIESAAYSAGYGVYRFTHPALKNEHQFAECYRFFKK